MSRGGRTRTHGEGLDPDVPRFLHIRRSQDRRALRLYHNDDYFGDR